MKGSDGVTSYISGSGDVGGWQAGLLSRETYQDRELTRSLVQMRGDVLHIRATLDEERQHA